MNFAAFKLDHEFGDCVDSFVMADLDQLKPRKRKRYLGEDSRDGRTET